MMICNKKAASRDWEDNIVWDLIQGGFSFGFDHVARKQLLYYVVGHAMEIQWWWIIMEMVVGSVSIMGSSVDLFCSITGLIVIGIIVVKVVVRIGLVIRVTIKDKVVIVVVREPVQATVEVIGATVVIEIIRIIVMAIRIIVRSFRVIIEVIVEVSKVIIVIMAVIIVKKGVIKMLLHVSEYKKQWSNCWCD